MFHAIICLEIMPYRKIVGVVDIDSLGWLYVDDVIETADGMTKS